MSKWTEVRDGVLSQINAEAMTEQFKQELYNKVITEFLPFISDVGEQTAKALEESAKYAYENRTICEAFEHLNSIMVCKVVTLNRSDIAVTKIEIVE